MIIAGNKKSNLPASRKEAISIGSPHYFTGRPCKSGHLSERTTKWKACCECSRIAALAWLDRNREKNADGCRKFHKDNQSEVAARHKKWRLKNRPLCKAGEHKRRARKANALPSWRGELDVLAAVEAGELAAMRESLTGFAWQVDHMIPLQAKNACGLHVGANLQVIPAGMNLSKNNKMILTRPGEWIGHI